MADLRIADRAADAPQRANVLITLFLESRKYSWVLGLTCDYLVSRMQSVKPRDLFLGLVLVAHPGEATIALSARLGMSTSQVHYALTALRRARLVGEDRRVRRAAMLEFLKHGAKYAFAAHPGPETLSIPTGIAAPMFADADSRAGAPLVWPTPTGTLRGSSIEPLSKWVPHAVRDDAHLYKLLSAVDAIRVGRAREASTAVEFLERELTS